MSNEYIARIVNAAVDCSIENRCIVYLMSNGDELLYTRDAETHESYKNRGYWTAAIFEDGRRVEA